MTTIRKIVTSKIDGDSANNTSIDEVRPFGETAFYLDQSFNPNKLTLMMFDGVKNHRDSKVLAPGVLWGSSGDGGGGGTTLDTIKLIPDAELYANASTDYHVVVDVIGEGQISLRAGGTLDSSSVDIVLGGTENHVSISDSSNRVEIKTSNGGISRTWTFNNSGLTFPDDTVQTTAAGNDTLATVTARGATTTASVTVNELITPDVTGATSPVVGFNIAGAPFPEGQGAGFSYTWVSSGPEVTQLIAQGANLIGAVVTQSEYAGTATVIGLPNLGGTLGIELDAAITYSPTNTLTFISPNYAPATPLPLDINVGTSTWTFGTTGALTLPGGGVIDGSDYDVEIAAGNDSSSTFGSVTINTQAPPAVYTIVQQSSPVGFDSIVTDVSLTPNYSEIVPGMVVTGSGITALTTVTSVTGPDIYGTVTINVSTPEGTGLPYLETYTITTASGVTDRNWYFNSLGEFYLPQGGAIQETQVTNELWGTTTTSLTLVPAGAANGTQRLEIYATGGGEGDHIHITSGDQNQTDLFLGNDTQYYAVAASGANYIQARSGYASPNPGTSAGPGANVNIYAGNAGDNGGNVADGNSGGDVFISSGISSSGLGGDILINTSSGPDGFGSIELSTDGGSSFWAFNKDNQIVFPNGTTQTTAYGFVTPPTSSTSTGVVGALAKDATYFYVCTATNSWQRIAWDITPW